MGEIAHSASFLPIGCYIIKSLHVVLVSLFLCFYGMNNFHEATMDYCFS